MNALERTKNNNLKSVLARSGYFRDTPKITSNVTLILPESVTNISCAIHNNVVIRELTWRVNNHHTLVNYENHHTVQISTEIHIRRRIMSITEVDTVDNRAEGPPSKTQDVGGS